jgi:IS4 transposase
MITKARVGNSNLFRKRKLNFILTSDLNNDPLSAQEKDWNKI